MELRSQFEPTISVSTLDPDRYAIFKKALSNVLSTDLAEFTMAQLVDGLPTMTVFCDGHSARNLYGHPIRSHESLCEGALGRTKEFRANFDPSVLELKSSLVQAFQHCPLESRQFDLRLIEMIATAVHSIAVFLFNLEAKSHKGDVDSAVSFREAERRIEVMPGEFTTILTLPPFPSIFTHTEYTFHEQYPHGLADVAGYWAEDQIFGGVVLFDRGESGTECKDVYLHSNRRSWTLRVWRPLESQLKQMLNFLKHGAPTEKSPFPLFADEKVRHRYDAYDAMAWHHIYRDPWERMLPAQKDEDSIRRNTFDYPELQEELFDKIPDGPFYTVGRDNAFLEGRDTDGQDVASGEDDSRNLADKGVKDPSADQSSNLDDEDVKHVAEVSHDVEEVETNTLQLNDSATGAVEVSGSARRDATVPEPEIDESTITEPDVREFELFKQEATAQEATDPERGNVGLPESTAMVRGFQSVELVAKKAEIDKVQMIEPEVSKDMTKDADVNRSQVQEPKHDGLKVDTVAGRDEACSQHKTGTP